MCILFKQWFYSVDCMGSVLHVSELYVKNDSNVFGLTNYDQWILDSFFLHVRDRLRHHLHLRPLGLMTL